MSTQSSDPFSKKKSSSDPPEKAKLWALAHSGTQMAVTILLGVFVGYKLDQKWDLSPWLTLTGSVLGILLGLYSFLKPFLFHDRKK